MQERGRTTLVQVISAVFLVVRLAKPGDDRWRAGGRVVKSQAVGGESAGFQGLIACYCHRCYGCCCCCCCYALIGLVGLIGLIGLN